MNEENQVIHRDTILPIPTDPALKVDVSTITDYIDLFIHCLFLCLLLFLMLDLFFFLFFFFTYTKVGRIKCPLLLVNAGDDQSWASVESAEDVSRTYFSLAKQNILLNIYEFIRYLKRTALVRLKTIRQY